MAFEHILFPIDFSDHSTRLNCEVEWLASRFGSRVTMLHVAEIPASWCGASDASPFSPECFPAFVESERQRLQEYALDVPETTLRVSSPKALRHGKLLSVSAITMWI